MQRMMARNPFTIRGLLVCLPALLLAATAPRVQAAANREQQDLVKLVEARLLAVTDPVPGYAAWPPKFEIQDSDEVNAYASADMQKDGDNIKLFAKVVVTTGMLRRVILTGNDPEPDSAADRLAFVMGHELGHVIHGHIIRRTPGKAPIIVKEFERQHEIQADLEGMKLLLKADFSRQAAVKGIQRMIDLRMEYSSFEGLGTDHPSWTDRLIRINQDRPEFWRAMSAFRNGVVFLLTEQYASAELCFLRVIKEYPNCYEAWSNLGYARLMRYCDGLDEKDLDKLAQRNVGQVVVGGFYQRPKSLEPRVRGMDENLWANAVEALYKALALQPSLTLAKVNLGVAYLVAPDGKNNSREAATLLREAKAGLSQALKEEELPPLALAALFLNSGVAEFADKQPAAAERDFLQVEKLRSEVIEPRLVGGRRTLTAGLSLSSALLYNRSLLLEKEKPAQARSLLEQYLQAASPASAWWKLAYKRYARLSKELAEKAKADEQLARKNRTRLRLVTSVQLPSGKAISLNQSLLDVEKLLGKNEHVQLAHDPESRTSLLRLQYPAQGVELLVLEPPPGLKVEQEVLAIELSGPQAPAVQLQSQGTAAKKSELRIGMTKEQLEQALDEEQDDYEMIELIAPEVYFRYYPDLGLAVRLSKGKLEQIVIAQIPRPAGR